MRTNTQNLSDDGRAIIAARMLKAGTWVRDEGGPTVYKIHQPGNSLLVLQLGESEPKRVAPGMQVVLLTPGEIERMQERHAMVREYANANAERLARLNAKAQPVILSNEPAGGPTPGAMFSHQAECPACSKTVWVTTAGRFLPHGPAAARCAQSGQAERKAA
jgi:hypothetical protein